MALVHNSESQFLVNFCITRNIPVVCCGQNGIAPLGQNGIMMSHCIGLKNITMQFVLSSHAYNISLTLFSRCTSLIVIIEKYYLVNNIHEECLFIQVRYNTAISPVHVIPTLQTCRIVYYILLYKPKSAALCFRLDQLIAYYCGRRNMAKFTSRFPRLRIPFNPTVG